MLETQRGAAASAPPVIAVAGTTSAVRPGTADETLGHIADGAERAAGEVIALWRPEGGKWLPEPWSALRKLRREVAAALAASGIQRGDRVAVVSQTRWEWGPIDLGILSVGAVTVGIYPTSTPAQVEYILQHSGAKVVFLENAAQAARLSEVIAALPSHPRVVVIAGEGFREFLSKGDAARADALAADVRPEDLATLVYTSGTTGHPKAVALTHKALIATSKLGSTFLGAVPEDIAVSYLPMAHVLTRVNYYGYIQVRGTAWFAESLEKVGEAWLAARPTVLSTVPRVLEKAQLKILAAVEASSPLRKKLFARALVVGLRRFELEEQGKSIPFALAAEARLWERLVFRKVRAKLGWDRVRFAMCGGAPIRPEILRFFHALGVVTIEGFGMTETASPISINHPTRWKLGTVGRALPGIEIQIAEDGEILVRSPGLFSRYEGDPESTAAAFDGDGFFKTGDVGELDEDGYLRITDRKKDLIKTAGGKFVAPQNIEAQLKADPRISQAVVFGDERPYLVALITLSPETLPQFDETRATQIAREVVETMNRSLAPYETVKRFKVLPEDFAVDNELLTPTLKVRRRAVQAKFQGLIASLYTEK
jgi:long-chain acyl-CoA synthetase